MTLRGRCSNGHPFIVGSWKKSSRLRREVKTRQNPSITMISIIVAAIVAVLALNQRLNRQGGYMKNLGNQDDLSRLLNEGGPVAQSKTANGPVVDYQTLKAKSNQNESSPASLVVIVRTVLPIAISAIFGTLAIGLTGQMQYIFAALAVIALFLFVGQFAWLNRKSKLTPELKL